MTEFVPDADTPDGFDAGKAIDRWKQIEADGYSVPTESDQDE